MNFCRDPIWKTEHKIIKFKKMNDEELFLSGLLAAADSVRVKNLISNPEHLAVITILF